MAKAKALTYNEFISYAQDNYYKGGDIAVECWDNNTFDEYVELFGPVTKKDARDMFQLWYHREKEAVAESW